MVSGVVAGYRSSVLFFFFQAEDGIRDLTVTGVQTCALPISLDAAGQPVPGAQIGWYDNAMQGEVDSTGVFTGGDQGYSRVTAVAYVPGVTGSQVFGTALVHVLPQPPARLDLDPRPPRLAAGSRLTGF